MLHLANRIKSTEKRKNIASTPHSLQNNNNSNVGTNFKVETSTKKEINDDDDCIDNLIDRKIQKIDMDDVATSITRPDNNLNLNAVSGNSDNAEVERLRSCILSVTLYLLSLVFPIFDMSDRSSHSDSNTNSNSNKETMKANDRERSSERSTSTDRQSNKSDGREGMTYEKHISPLLLLLSGTLPALQPTPHYLDDEEVHCMKDTLLSLGRRRVTGESAGTMACVLE